VVYSLEEGRLVKKSRTERKQISLDDLDGTQWRLVALGADQQAALPENGITLQFDNGQISGFAGCNDYTSAVSSGDYGRNSIKVDSIITTTQKSCSDPVASQEKSYLEALANASAWCMSTVISPSSLAWAMIRSKNCCLNPSISKLGV